MGKKYRILLLVLVIGIVCVLSWAMPALAIQNGQPDGDDHPYVCLVVFYDADDNPMWRTTGVLVSSTVVLTAGHGTYDDATGKDCAGARVWFLTDIPQNPDKNKDMYPYGGPDSYPGTPYTNPLYRTVPEPGLPGFDYHDVGVVVLDEEAPIHEYGELPEAGYVDTLSKKSFVDLVGYGVNYQENGGGVGPYYAWQWARARYYAPAQLINTQSVTGSEFLKLTANPGQDKGGTTFGDSGGPILDAGTNVILGLNSFVNSYNCTGVTYAQRMDIPDILEWIEGEGWLD